jgi:hypothetical protein
MVSCVFSVQFETDAHTISGSLALLTRLLHGLANNAAQFPLF